MFNTKKTQVKKIISADDSKIEIVLEDDSRAIAYTQFTPEINVGDEVVVNTTAVDLGLGTGGYHFVISNLSSQLTAHSSQQVGHIMKLRYTPLQFSTLSAESQESDYHELLKDKKSIEGLPVIIGSLHSQLSSSVATIKYLNEGLKVAYIMTDGAALPIGLSNTVNDLKEKRLIDTAITCGQAFGGDLDAVNIYSALICAKYVAKADIVFVSMGPGVVGTGSLLGTSAIEVGQIVNAVASLEGRAIVIPRLSFKDKRVRHQGVSHHTITALISIALAKATVVLPFLSKKDKNYVDAQLSASGLAKKHNVKYVKNDITEKALKNYGLAPTTMGRGFEEEREFFMACGCAAIEAINEI